MKRSKILDLVTHHRDFRHLDLIALQEASAHELGDDATLIAHALGDTYASYHHVYNYLKLRPQANALVWNSSHVRLDAIEHHILPTHSQVHISRAERAILNRMKRQPRVNLVGEGAYRNLSVRVCAAHLDVLGYRFKRHQFRAILDDLRDRPPVDLLILAGDFNTFRIGGRPTWAQLKRDAAELNLRAISDEIKWTQSTLRMKQKLDEIFLATSRPCHSHVWSLDVKGSDHLPIFAEITIE
jgi:endonuclease/exonuclease/phosphatase family metal-dependent hydrolase